MLLGTFLFECHFWFAGLTPRGRHRLSVRPKVPGSPPTAQERQKLTSFLHFSTPAGGTYSGPLCLCGRFVHDLILSETEKEKTYTIFCLDHFLRTCIHVRHCWFFICKSREKKKQMEKTRFLCTDCMIAKLQKNTQLQNFRWNVSSLLPGIPDAPLNIQVDVGPQDGTLLVTWLPVTITTAGTSNGCLVTGYSVYVDGHRVKDLTSPTSDHVVLGWKDMLDVVSDLRQVRATSGIKTTRTKKGKKRTCVLPF